MYTSIVHNIRYDTAAAAAALCVCNAAVSYIVVAALVVRAGRWLTHTIDDTQPPQPYYISVGVAALLLRCLLLLVFVVTIIYLEVRSTPYCDVCVCMVHHRGTSGVNNRVTLLPRCSCFQCRGWFVVVAPVHPSKRGGTPTHHPETALPACWMWMC